MEKGKMYTLTGSDQARLIRNKEISPVELVDEIFNRIHQLNPTFNAFCELDEENAKKTAVQAEQDIMKGKEVGPLHGVPVAIKDLVSTKGIRTTFGSKIYENFIPDEDDVCVERLRQAGAVILGKTNVPEFGYQGVTHSKLLGVTRSPWNTDLTPGGSSGGSAVAVATGMGSLAIGNDGGGSIRIPASFSGIYGIKPSFGRVPLYPGCRDPRYPGASGWESLEANGPLTRTVEDSALMLSVIAGPSHMDRHSIPGNIDFLGAIQDKNIKGLKVAWSPDWGYAAVDPRVRTITAEAVKVFERLGCDVEEAHPGFSDPYEAFWGLVARDTDLKGLRKLVEQYRDQVGPTLLSFIQKDWTAEELTDAAMIRQDVNIKMRRFMEKYDLLITPTLCVPPFETGINGPTQIEGREVPDAHWLSFTYPINMTGQPAATVPAGWTEDGLPIGLQIIGRHLDDGLVLQASSAYEEANPWAFRLLDMMGGLQ